MNTFIECTIQCSGLNSGSQENTFMPQSLGHADVTVSQKRAFADRYN